jgi:hypothetical protein
MSKQHVELFGCNFGGRRPPAVPVAKQDDKIGTRRGLLAALDFGETNLHRLLVLAGFFAYSPPQVNRLKSSAVTGAKLAQPRKDPLMKRVPLLLEVAKSRADKYPKGPKSSAHHLAVIAQ